MDLSRKMMFILGDRILSEGHLPAMWRTGCHDLSDAAWASLSDVVRRRQSQDNLTALEHKWQQIAREALTSGKALRTASTMNGHVITKAISVAAMNVIAAGSAIAAFSLFCR